MENFSLVPDRLSDQSPPFTQNNNSPLPDKLQKKFFVFSTACIRMPWGCRATVPCHHFGFWVPEGSTTTAQLPWLFSPWLIQPRVCFQPTEQLIRSSCPHLTGTGMLRDKFNLVSYYHGAQNQPTKRPQWAKLSLKRWQGCNTHHPKWTKLVQTFSLKRYCL